eukprot:7669034-Lingulodinium_polyedra.AAC.1
MRLACAGQRGAQMPGAMLNAREMPGARLQCVGHNLRHALPATPAYVSETSPKRACHQQNTSRAR